MREKAPRGTLNRLPAYVRATRFLTAIMRSATLQG